jgi:hypothetical protein
VTGRSLRIVEVVSELGYFLGSTPEPSPAALAGCAML